MIYELVEPHIPLCVVKSYLAKLTDVSEKYAGVLSILNAFGGELN